MLDSRDKATPSADREDLQQASQSEAIPGDVENSSASAFEASSDDVQQQARSRSQSRKKQKMPRTFFAGTLEYCFLMSHMQAAILQSCSQNFIATTLLLLLASSLLFAAASRTVRTVCCFVECFWLQIPAEM